MRPSRDNAVSVAQLAAKLNLDKSAASRRVRVAEGLGYVINLEDRKGKPARLVLGDDLPDSALLRELSRHALVDARSGRFDLQTRPSRWEIVGARDG